MAAMTRKVSPLSAVFKVVTSCASLLTAAALVRLVPRADIRLLAGEAKQSSYNALDHFVTDPFWLTGPCNMGRRLELFPCDWPCDSHGV